MKKLILLIALHLILLWAVRYIAWPENFLWSYLNLNGLVFYRDIFYIYPPLYVLFLTAFYKLVHLGLFQLYLFSYLIIAATDIALWLAARKKLFPVLLFIPLQIFFEGNSTWPDQLIAPFLLFAYLLFRKKKFFLTGLFLGLAVLTKQTAGYFATGLVLLSVLQERKILSPSKIILGSAVPALILIPWFLANHNFPAFFAQAGVYILTYHAKNPLQIQYPTLRETLTVTLVFLPPLLVALYRQRFSLALLTVLASLGVFTRFSYFHLQPALPFIALLIGETPILLFPYAVFVLVFIRFFVRSFNQPAEFLTPDILSNAKIINRYLPPGSHTLFVNTWDHYYYLTKTLPVGNFFVSSTPWNLNYDGIQDKLTQNLAKNQPEYVVFNDCFFLKNQCFRPEKVKAYLFANYREILKLPDGTGIFQYYPVRLGKEVQTQNR